MLKMTILLSSLLSTFAMGAEVDHFSRRDIVIPDASEIVNQKANEDLKNALADLNKLNSGCDENLLYKELRKYFGNHIKGDFTKFVIEDPSVPRLKIPINESIYKDWTSFTGFILGSPLYRKSGIALSDLVRVGEIEIGTDKFEHLFGRGFYYFKSHYLKNKSLHDTLRAGVNQEKYIYGGLSIETGVFSYADLAANFNGMRFWNHVLLKNNDILGENFNLGPYIVCENNLWKQNAQIDFRNYFDKTMDESVNCSKYSVSKSVKIVNEALKKLNESCPSHQDLSPEIQSKYGEYSKYIINKNGIGKVNYRGEFGDFGGVKK